MKKIIASSMLALACSLTPCISPAAQIDGVDIINYGVYVTSSASNTEKNADGAGGQEKTWKLVKRGDRIPATIATSFGMEYVIKGRPEGERVQITLRYLHPTILNPKTGKTYTSQEVSITTLVGKKVHEGYTFDHEWELVSGAWVIQVFSEGRKLGEQYFTVYKP